MPARLAKPDRINRKQSARIDDTRDRVKMMLEGIREGARVRKAQLKAAASEWIKDLDDILGSAIPDDQLRAEVIDFIRLYGDAREGYRAQIEAGVRFNLIRKLWQKGIVRKEAMVRFFHLSSKSNADPAMSVEIMDGVFGAGLDKPIVFGEGISEKSKRVYRNNLIKRLRVMKHLS